MNQHTLDLLAFPRVIDLLRAKCVTSPGRTLASRLVPFRSEERVRALQERLAEMLSVIELRGEPPVDPLDDLTPLLARSAVDGAALEPSELLALSRSARLADDLRRFAADDETRWPSFHALAAGLDPLVDFQMSVARAIDTEGEIVDSASGELAAIRSEIGATRSEVRRILDGYLQSNEVKRSLQESIITLRNGRYVLPVKGGDRRAVEGIVHDHSGSGATLFVEPIETVAKNNALTKLRREEAREIRRILRGLTKKVASAAGAFGRNLEIIGEIDFLRAKARLAAEWGCSLPAVRETAPLRIERGRHPLLEISLHRGGRAGELVPLDIHMPDDCRSIVLTGPNTGGKTVALKTVGLFALMAQSGLALPAEEGTSLPLFRSIHAVIGDDQSIEENLSSFSAHLSQVVDLLRSSDERTLVLIDEIGAGTDPAEGSALAMALLEEIHRRRATSLVTTHLGSLKVFVHNTPGMVNASMAFDTDRMRPTYRLEIGLPGTSHALEIARRLGVDDEVISRARENLGSSELELASLLHDLKERSRHLERLIASTTEEKAMLDALERKVREREEAVRRDERLWKRKALEEAKRYLDESRSLVERQVREIRRYGGRRQSVREARAAIEKERARLAGGIEELRAVSNTECSDDDLAKGRFVRIRSLNRVGRITGRSNRGDRFLIESGGVRLEAARNDLVPADEPRPKRAKNVLVGAPLRDAKLELDLRGMTAQEASAAADRFIDDAVLAGVGSVRIIHGIGTGVLRKTIQELLAADPRVGSTKLAKDGGSSVVEMGE